MTLLTHSERSAHDVTLVQYDNGDVVEVFAVSATVSVDEMDVRHHLNTGRARCPATGSHTATTTSSASSNIDSRSKA